MGQYTMAFEDIPLPVQQYFLKNLSQRIAENDQISVEQELISSARSLLQKVISYFSPKSYTVEYSYKNCSIQTIETYNNSSQNPDWVILQPLTISQNDLPANLEHYYQIFSLFEKTSCIEYMSRELLDKKNICGTDPLIHNGEQKDVYFVISKKSIPSQMINFTKNIEHNDSYEISFGNNSQSPVISYTNGTMKYSFQGKEYDITVIDAIPSACMNYLRQFIDHIFSTEREIFLPTQDNAQVYVHQADDRDFYIIAGSNIYGTPLYYQLSIDTEGHLIVKYVSAPK